MPPTQSITCLYNLLVFSTSVRMEVLDVIVLMVTVSPQVVEAILCRLLILHLLTLPRKRGRLWEEDFRLRFAPVPRPHITPIVVDPAKVREVGLSLHGVPSVSSFGPVVILNNQLDVVCPEVVRVRLHQLGHLLVQFRLGLNNVRPVVTILVSRSHHSQYLNSPSLYRQTKLPSSASSQVI